MTDVNFFTRILSAVTAMAAVAIVLLNCSQRHPHRVQKLSAHQSTNQSQQDQPYQALSYPLHVLIQGESSRVDYLTQCLSDYPHIQFQQHYHLPTSSAIVIHITADQLQVTLNQQQHRFAQPHDICTTLIKRLSLVHIDAHPPKAHILYQRKPYGITPTWLIGQTHDGHGALQLTCQQSGEQFAPQQLQAGQGQFWLCQRQNITGDINAVHTDQLSSREQRSVFTLITLGIVLGLGGLFIPFLL